MQGSHKTGLLLAGVAIVALVAGLLAGVWLTPETQPTPVSVVTSANQAGVPDIRPGFSLPDLDGRSRDISEWQGKVLIINFWATWCPPCLKEMPALMELRESLRAEAFEIIGVALDQPQAVRDFVDQLGIEYPILVAEIDGMRVMQDYGNQLMTLPYTVVIDRENRVRKVFRKEVTLEMIRSAVEPLLKKEP